jgi:hypothetical protein
MTDRAEEGVHQLVLAYGRERARSMVDERDKTLVDIAAEVLGDEGQEIGISYTGFCLTSLPHKRLADDEIWERKGHNVTLLIEPGSMKRGEKTVKYGVPYGSRARMILLYLQTQAVRTGSREIALGNSMRDWMERMNVSVGGETASSLREQAARISACSLKFFWQGEDSNGWARGGIVSSGFQFNVRDDRQDGLWDDRVILDEVFWKALRDHPVPLQEAAIKQLAHRSMALDVYIWLAWRCHRLENPTKITWLALNSQFGVAGRQLKHFKPLFTEALKAASAAYPGSRVTTDERGIVVFPAKPPVSKLVK